MWQRIQTVFLGGVVIVMLFSLVQPVWSFEGDDSTIVLTPFYFMSEGEYQYIPYSLTAILSMAAATIAFTSIRKFKNRLLQMKLGALNSLLLAGVLVCSVYFSMQLIKEYQGGHYGISMFLPAVAVVCNFLANFFIRRDEKLVRDSERLR